uniref:Uncharacterized protein n=1 Tax=Rousettus aegyptiacus TaxID=9407 RepID=A0A7J8H232_ROUAE|nr:hypothetical protein HJG63_011437 [Rousettus aegyptiacus]
MTAPGRGLPGQPEAGRGIRSSETQREGVSSADPCSSNSSPKSRPPVPPSATVCGGAAFKETLSVPQGPLPSASCSWLRVPLCSGVECVRLYLPAGRPLLENNRGRDSWMKGSRESVTPKHACLGDVGRSGWFILRNSLRVGSRVI